MKDVINILLKNLYLTKIPPQILEITFEEMCRQQHRSLDAIIREVIIIDIVLMSCNLFAGKTKKIILYENYGKDVRDDTFQAAFGGNFGVYTIPPEARENRSIGAVLDVAYPTTIAAYGTFPNQTSTGTSVAGETDEVLSSFTRLPVYLTPMPMLIDGDAGVIGLSPPAALHIDWILSCILQYDKNFSNISPNMIPSLRDMTELALKAYIYNTMIVKINQGFLQGGQQLDSIKSIIESYADSNEKFYEALRKFRGAATFSPEEFRNLLSMMIG